MYSKIALNNIKKSLKDYTIYFVTLTLAVCMFYNFNTIETQMAVYEVNKSKIQSVSFLVDIIYYMSIFIAIVFGSLIIYANNALVKKRKKEFSIYGILGMSKLKISQILVTETLIIGAISLVVGLLLGVVLSQGISVLVGNLFEFGMDKYKFIFSMDSIIKTIMYFAVIFLLVIILNTLVMSRNKVIDLMNASKKNEEVKVRNSIISILITILAVIILGKAYYLGWEYAVDCFHNPKNIKLPLALLLGALGTLILFFGIGNFILAIAKKSNKIYLKRLNIFVIQQFSNKINTNFISMTIISLMLFVTIIMLSTSVSFKHEIEKINRSLLVFDASAELYVANDKQGINNINDALKIVDFKMGNDYKHSVLDVYNSNIKIKSLVNEYADSDLKEKLKKSSLNANIIKISQYNELRKLRGDATITLKEKEILFISSDENIDKALSKLKKDKKEIKFKNEKYNIKSDEISKEKYTNAVNELTLVVNDKDLKDLKLTSSIININVSKKDKQELEDKIKEFNRKLENQQNSIDGNYLNMRVVSKSEQYRNINSTVGSMVYIAIYLGFVFLVSSAAVLAIQQLTEVSNSLDRYKVLKEIGSSDEMINKSIFAQILVHLGAPLLVAIIHLIVGLNILNRIFERNIAIGTSSIIVSGIIVIIYSVYFYATYLGYKNIVKSN